MKKTIKEPRNNVAKQLLGWVAALSLMAGLVAQASADELVRINFRDADIRSVIESVAEITGKSFVLDPRVKGKVTIISPEAIDASLLYQAVLSAIQVQGFQAIEDGVVTRIVPFNQAFNFAGGAGNNELITKVIQVDHVQVANLVPVLKPMMSSGARLQAFAQSNTLVVTDVQSNLVLLESVLKDLDDPELSAVEVISLEHISAGEAVHIAGQLKQLKNQELSLVEDGMNNRVIVSGPGAARRAFKTMLKTLDQPSTKKGSVEVIYLDYSRAAEMKPIVEGMLQSDIFLQLAGEAGAEGKSKSNYQIQIDELSNALVVAAPTAVIREIKNVVTQLDRSRPQVLIEAVIAELSEDQAKRLSAQLAYTSKNRGGYLTKFDNLLTTLIGVGADGDVSSADATALGAALGTAATTIGVAGDFDPVTGKGIGVLIQALKTDGSTKILSTPSVVTLDNEEATLSVGEEVPFQTGSFTSSNNGSNNPFTTINREEVGVKLKVKPQISKGDSVRLEIEQESSKVKSGEPGLQTTSKSTMQTNVLIQDGELLILGGLIEDQTNGTATKVPLLGDIPLLGRLFRSTSKSDSQSVLMMFIRPTIIRTAEDARNLSESKYRHLIKRDLETQEGGLIQPRFDEFIQEGEPSNP
ncbi:MAG: type II secretion system secretin GspD [Porticoccaceae bacterium]|jgi:general secretion pathway protein D|nr:MAG: type II secretion system protein GspD [SAR92 bacterium BACL16 MAG-120619-bin48]KRP26253.1 MAG: type II secretion system protein GspD [SAR92 bacterium BACL16 MAG-120322-bin99]MDP4654218.1 type II secretion system secretin GspD [Alphaproteobacteria bacterium]MDP4744151.1 type II secretion system secretin GspD [Porticoccaceae bacterium]MDP4752677.1 type II secretion system secretin GspD [Porticoccaceae bacterium]|tara:strand:- start:1975 stop:3894 length:1920 start_codon:yes stop_codon:yes gene_type:complete